MISPDGEAPSKPSAARIYDRVLGGTYNYEIDRIAADKLCEIEPLVPQMAWANRGFLQRVATWLTHEVGLQQVIDLGAGLPTAQNTHEIVAPGCRVAYLDHDPEVVEHGQRLLQDVPGAAYFAGELCEEGLLDKPELRSLIDLDQPVGLLIVGVLYFVPDEADPLGAVRRLVDELPSGSYLAASHIISDRQSEEKIKRATDVYKGATDQLRIRTMADLRSIFSELEVVPPYPGAPPALDYIGNWGALDLAEADDDTSRWFGAGVGRKP